MRLIFFDFTINYGGAPQGSVYLARRLNAEHDVHVIDAYGCCDDYHQAVRQAGLPCHVLCPEVDEVYIGYENRPFKRLACILGQIPAFLRLRSRLAQVVREIDPDVIWVNNEKSLILLASCWTLKKYPVVVYVRGWATSNQVRPRYRWLLKRRVSAIIAHARASIDQLKQRGLPKTMLHYTPNTIPFGKIVEDSRKPLSQPWPDFSKSPKILLPAARPVREKGHLTALKAVARLKESGYDPVLWLPGQTATGVGNAFVKELHDLIAEKGLQANVNFLGWREDIIALIQQSDIVILPTHTEGFPRVILEAMLLQKPVIATPVGGVPEAVKDCQTGLLVDVDDDCQLADAIRRYLKDHEFRDSVVQNAYDFVTNTFKPEINTQIVCKVFQSVQRNRISRRS